MAEFVVDSKKSVVRIRTFAEGLFARLAHDLELTCRDVSGRATTNEAAALTGSATVEVPIGQIEVAGVLHGERVDAQGLSANDRADCLAKMRQDVFHAGASGMVRVHVVADGGAVRLRIEPPNGRSVERTLRPQLDAVDGGVRVKGTVDLSLSAIGSATVKGPMNAFRVKDRIEILFDVVFQPA